MIGCPAPHISGHNHLTHCPDNPGVAAAVGYQVVGLGDVKRSRVGCDPAHGVADNEPCRARADLEVVYGIDRKDRLIKVRDAVSRVRSAVLALSAQANPRQTTPAFPRFAQAGTIQPAGPKAKRLSSEKAHRSFSGIGWR